MSRVPRIRFKGFEEDWEQRKLINCLSLLKDGTHGTHKDYPSGPLLLSAKNIKNGRVYYDETDRRISYKDFEKIYRNFKLQIGDILLTIVGSIGETALLKDSFEITFQRSVAFLRAKDNILPEFLMSEFNTGRFRNELEDRKSTSAQPGIYLGDLGEIPVFVSKNPAEQRRVGSYFESLDHLITLHQRKLEKLKIIKKSMLENLFPQNGEKTPKIRFSGFTKDWEQRKFGELYVLVNEKNDGSYSKDSNITVATMQFKSNIQISKNEYLNTYNIFKKGYIAFEGHKSKEFRFGRFVENDIGDGIVSHIFIVFRPIMEFDINFWKYAINNELIMQSILSRATKASTMMNDLVVKDFLKEIFFVPSVGEQACIGKTLKTIDHLITLHQSKLEKLQKIKKSMLESMFV